MLNIEGISASYGDLQVLFDVSLHVDQGEVVCLVGSNGAGKTTLLQIISGLMPVKAGKIIYQGIDLLSKGSHQRAELGIAHIPQGRGILGTLTVKENLIMGSYTKNVRKNYEENQQKVFGLFPILKERQNQMAGTLSGGEQQMLAIGRSLMMEPKLLMLDEPSLGLAPIIVEEVFEIIKEVAKQGVQILIVEQNLMQALSIASRGYVLEVGKVALEGKASELLNSKKVREAYLGV
jgi:branched-chain amino acid transport system ATP-binding protein